MFDSWSSRLFMSWKSWLLSLTMHLMKFEFCLSRYLNHLENNCNENVDHLKILFEFRRYHMPLPKYYHLSKWDISISTKWVISKSKLFNCGMKREVNSRTGILRQSFIISIMWSTHLNGVLLFLFFSAFHIGPGKKARWDQKDPIQSEENRRKALMNSVGFGTCFWTENCRKSTCILFFFFFLRHLWASWAFTWSLLVPSIYTLFLELINQWNGLTSLHSPAYQVIDDRFIFQSCFSYTFLMALLWFYWLLFI